MPNTVLAEKEEKSATNLQCANQKELAQILNDVSFLNGQKSVVIRLSGGGFELTEPVEMRGINVNLKITGGKNCVLQGSQKLENVVFSPVEGDIYCASIGTGYNFGELYINAKKYILARYPNYAEDEILDGCCEDVLSKSRVAKWSNPSGGFMRALHENEWGGNSFIIEGKNPDNTLNLKWVGDNNRGAGYHKKCLMVENIFEELDDAGEWFYDKNNGKLYAIPHSGDNLHNCSIEIVTNGELFHITDCKNVTFESITFAKTKRRLFDSEYEKITRSDWAISRTGAIYLKNSEQMNFLHCNFSEIGGNCIFIDSKNTDISVKNCNFKNCGASGVAIFGSPACCADLSTWENHKTTIRDFTIGAVCDNYPKDILIADCEFYNLGNYELQSAAVTMSICKNVTVRGCTIHHLPRAGINICDGNFGGHWIENNDIFDTVRETSDHGPINSWGRDRFWSLKKFDTLGRFGRMKRPYALLDAVETTVIRNNRVSGTRGFGIDLDDGSSNYEICGNLCYGVGIKLREGFVRNVHENILINAPLDLHATFAQNDDIITDNVIACENPLCVVYLNKGFTTVFKNNLFYNCNKKVLKSKVAKKYKNYIRNGAISDIMKMEYDEIPSFKKIDLHFGVEGAATPKSESNSAVIPQNRCSKGGVVFCDIDESLRSLCGLPSKSGAYVEKISIFSFLYRFGIRKGDAITQINEDTIENSAGIHLKKKVTAVTVFRKQQTKLLQMKQ